MTLKHDIAESIVSYMFECEDYDRGVQFVIKQLELYVEQAFNDDRKKCVNCGSWRNNGFWCRSCESYMSDSETLATVA